MFLLDTNVVSELRKAKSGRADPNVVSWAAAIFPDLMYISAITLLELERRVLAVERRDASQGVVLRHWLDRQVVPAFQGRVLGVDADVALACARLHVPDPRGECDALIAATALVQGLTLVTRNVADFAATKVPVLNPWSSGPPAR